MRRRRWRSALVAIALVVAVPGTPMARTLQTACDRCPPTCPMHRHGKPKCHETRERQAPGRHHCGRSPVGVAAPGCGHRTEPPVASLAPAVLPGAVHSWSVRAPSALPPAGLPAPTRGADPPDTPPPILSV